MTCTLLFTPPPGYLNRTDFAGNLNVTTGNSAIIGKGLENFDTLPLTTCLKSLQTVIFGIDSNKSYPE